MKTAQANNAQLTGAIELSPNKIELAIKPQASIDMLQYHGYTVEAKEFARDITIEDAEHEIKAVDGLKRIKMFSKECEDIRKAKKEPFFDMCKRIDAAFKPISDGLADAEKIIKDKINEYLRKLEVKRQAEAAEAQKKFDEDNLKALEDRAFTGKSVEVPVPEIVLQKTESRGNYGSASQKSNWKWELVDLSKVPAEYMTVDESKLTAVVKGGVRSIPGIRIYDDKTISIR